MEDYIETFLYILFTIVFIVLGSLRKKKKQTISKNVKNNDAFEEIQNTDKRPKTIFDLLEQQFEEPENKIVEEEFQPPATQEPKLENQPVEMVENVERQIDSAYVEEEIKKEDQHEPDFNLRSAIIYSEIINRKYY